MGGFRCGTFCGHTPYILPGIVMRLCFRNAKCWFSHEGAQMFAKYVLCSCLLTCFNSMRISFVCVETISII